MLIIALILNVIIVVCEIYTLGHINGKINILKYYTYLQNLIGLFASLILVWAILSGNTIPEFVRGVRYIATCGLTATTFIFLTFLGAGKKIAMTEDDFLPGCSPKTANAILHYICPMLSLISFVVLEREIQLSNGIWTTLSAVPSCGYWIIYLILSAAKVWEEPYQLESNGKGGKIREGLIFLLIPLSFVAISFALWNVK